MPKEINISDKKGTVDTQEIQPPVIEKDTPEVAQIDNKEIQKKNTKEEKTDNKKRTINKNLLIFSLVAVLSVIGIASFFYFGIYKLRPVPPKNVAPFSEDFVSSIGSTSTFASVLTLLQKPSEPRTEESPINGLLFTKAEMIELKKRRPVAVMISNHSDARPVSGLSSADIVIEANAEGGITRHIAIFWSKGPEKVGSLRSIRQYFLEWASEYDPLIIRVGCAASKDPRTNACYNISLYKNIQEADIFWRWDDGRRYAPHNAYSSVKAAWEKGVKNNWGGLSSKFESWKFKRDAEITERGEKTIVSVIFHKTLKNSGLYDTIWTYDKTTNSYFRKVGGQASIDQETNKQINAKNVVIQTVKMVYSGDSKGHLIITTIGEGDAVILQDGKIINGKWKKDSRTDRTTYYDSNGKEIEFNRGQIWIAMLPHSDGKFAIIEQ